MTAVIAMLFLVLFATLAVGFYAATGTATQVASNDARVNRALLAAESGMDFMRYQMLKVNIPSGTAPSAVIDQLYPDLQAQLDGSGNLAGQTISRSGNTISIPAGTGSISLGNSDGSTFRATITDWAGEEVIKIDGYSGGQQVTRSITMDFSRRQRTSSAFNYAVASRGQVVMRKGAVTSVTGVDPAIATMMSAQVGNPSVDVSGGTVGGDLSYVTGGVVQVSGGSVGGSSIPSQILADHTHEVDTPEFPTVDTTVFRGYATNNYVSGARTQQNIRIPANTNPRFNGGDTVQGIMYIESPNTVVFRGNFNLQGFIVFENAGDESQNVLDFRGNVSQTPLPSGSQFDVLRATTGVAILGPTASVNMSGSTDSFLKGNLLIGSLNYNGSADIQIDRGTVMTYNPGANSARFNGKTVRFTATGSNNQPSSGVTYSSYFNPDPGSYQEISP